MTAKIKIMRKKLISIASGILIPVILILNVLAISEVKATITNEEGSGWACEHCNHAGGPGATSCSCKIEILDLKSECSVTVGTGYYACCRTTLLDRCNCLSCQNLE